MTETTVTGDEAMRAMRAGRRRAVWRTALAAAALVLAAASVRAEPILYIAGVTAGCFGTGCSAFDSPATSSSTYGLTFTGAAFSEAIADTGSAGDLFLGSFSRANVNVSNDLPGLDFTLQVTFMLPMGLSGSGDPFTAFIEGTNYGGGGGLAIDFDNAWRFFEFSNGLGTGSFEFALLSDLLVPKNNSRDLFGTIRNATFAPLTSGPAQPIAVPEPSGLVLLGAGLAGVLARRRLRSGHARTA